MFKRMSKMHMVIQLCERPRRFGELKDALHISEAGLTKHLDAVQRLGWVEKADDGTYVLTAAGKRVLPTAQRASAALSEFKRAPIDVKGATIDYAGLQEKEARAFLRSVAIALGRYLADGQRRPFSVLVSYKPSE